MKIKSIHRTLFCSFLLTCGAAHAAGGVESGRSFGMAGAGVSMATGPEAVLHNPALLGMQGKDDDFGLTPLAFHGRLTDQNDLNAVVSDLKDGNFVAKASSALDKVYTAQSLQELRLDGQLLQRAVNNLTGVLQRLSDRSLVGEASALSALAMPSAGWSWGVVADTRLLGSGFAHVDGQDIQLLNQLAADVATLNLASLSQNTKGGKLVFPDLKSALNARFVLISEAGLSVSKTLRIGGKKASIGLLPKWQWLNVFDYVFSESTINGATAAGGLDSAKLSLNTGESRQSAFNMDIGYVQYLTDRLRIGVTVHDLLRKTHTSVLGNKITIQPLARAGISYQGSWYTLAMDGDLNSREPVAFEKRGHLLSLGAELGTGHFINFRMGYQYHSGDNKLSTPTLGLGLALGFVHADLGLSYSNRSVGGALQASINF